MSILENLTPIYTTRGDVGAYLSYPYLYNAQGEWIGWISEERSVYSIRGHYVGWLSPERRIIGKRARDYVEPRRDVPLPPPPIHIPALTPLAPQMPELTLSTVDILEEAPELLPTADFGELHEDMD